MAATEVPAVPRNAVMNQALMTLTLMLCMAAMPWDAGSAPNAGMTNVEKAKNIPPTKPLPSAVARVSEKTPLDIPHAGRCGGADVVGEVAGRAAERLLHAVVQVCVAAVEHLGEQV